MIKVTIIIPSYNGADLLPDCLDSIETHYAGSEDIQIIVVDNGSEDDSASVINGHFPHVFVIKNENNRGFAEACNIGAAGAAGDYLVFLNNDARVKENWIENLISGIDENNGVVCTSSRIEDRNGVDIEFGGGEINFSGLGFQRSSWNDKYKPLKEQAFLPFACGCSMLISKRIFLEIGGFDNDFFAFYEDVDLGWRLNLLGYKIRYCPESSVTHYHHATAKNLNKGFRYFLWTRNSLMSVLKNYEDKNVAKVFTAAVLLSLERVSQFKELKDQAVKLKLHDIDEKYINDIAGTAQAILWVFENLEKILVKREWIQRNRKLSDKEFAADFDLKIEFDDITKSEPENILASIIIDYFDFSDLFTKEKTHNYILHSLSQLKETCRTMTNQKIASEFKAADLERENDAMKHRILYLEGKEKMLAENNNTLAQEMDEIRNSRSFKILKRVRKLSSPFQRSRKIPDDEEDR